jgi:2-polyprenyl-3-methyl-5-hydroxy-6-metoxy-1,4-benzoquinol methylase
MKCNPAIDQDRTGNVAELMLKYGYAMFPQQRVIYRNLAERLKGSVLEAGCGDGLGTAIIDNRLTRLKQGTIVGTDKLEANVKVARELYEWIPFFEWDIELPMKSVCHYDSIVCVEAIEHVANPALAITNLVRQVTSSLWISTPNGVGKSRPPKNPYHVCEYTPTEMVELIRNGTNTANREVEYIQVLEHRQFAPVSLDTLTDPVVYYVVLKPDVA